MHTQLSNMDSQRKVYTYLTVADSPAGAPVVSSTLNTHTTIHFTANLLLVS